MKLSEDASVVFHGFLNLPNLEKLSIVEAINEYFDSNEREPIRNENEVRFEEIFAETPTRKCVCCGHPPVN